jgi:GTP-binding protein EngB required for normal cell division
MGQYIFEGDYENKAGNVQVRLILFHFQDENSIHFIYSPHLDLTGYGYTLEEAKKSFEWAFSEFTDYTLKKKTLGKVLKKLDSRVKKEAQESTGPQYNLCYQRE